MTEREECLRLTMEFVQSGDIDKATAAVGTILAYIATLDGSDTQLAALDDLHLNLANRCNGVELSDEAQDRHVAVEDAIEQARSSLASKTA